MLINYFKIAVRNLLRHKSFSVINILGLTIGLTAFLAIGLYVNDELSYDQFHEMKDHIYRAVLRADFDGQVTKWGAAPNLLGPTAMKEIPEVAKASRYFHHNFGDLAFISTDIEKFSEKELHYADPELFEIFTIPLTKGNAQKILDRPNTVVISESASKKYFGGADPIGKTLTVDNSIPLEVTGVFRDFPSNSFLQANLIASFTSHWFGADKNQSWGNASFDTFFLLHEGVTKEAFDQKLEAMLQKNIEKDNRWFTLSAQPLTDIRLGSGDLNATFDRRSYGDMKQVQVLGALAIVILIIAAVNYMNLTTAQSQRRNKEVGINKTLGATFRQLSLRFYFEASLFVLISMILSLVAFTLVLPVFNSLTGKLISEAFYLHIEFWFGFVGLWMLLTFLSGFYPAWYLSSFSPKSALNKNLHSGGQATVRKGLVIVQFSASIVLIICSIVLYRQMNFIQTKKLGYEPEQVVAVMTTSAKTRDEVMSLKTEYENLASVVSVARAQAYPGVGASGRNILRDGEDKVGSSLQTVRATREILKTLNIKLLAGTSLPETKEATDTTVQVVINKATVDYLGLTPEEVIGKRVNIQGFYGATEVVGVMDDFHYASLHQKIGPICFHNANRTEPFNYLLVKVNTGDLPATINQLETLFKKNISSSFEYTFLDQQMNSLYTAEQNMSNVMLLFAALAIFIACLGLYALAAFTAEQRTKEIGIRKVMGASVTQLVTLLSKDFLILVAVAFVIGIPAGYYVMNQWLQGFAYCISLDVFMFVAAGMISLVIAWGTVSIESIKAAIRNPVNSLRSE